jgi:hypothetical protein
MRIIRYVELSTGTLPLQLFATPPAALHPHKVPSPAQLEGEDKAMFVRHVNEYLECFENCESLLNAGRPLSRLMSDNWRNGNYWFHSALTCLWDFDYPFWNYVFPRQFADQEEESTIARFKANPIHSDIHQFVESKLKDLVRYREDIKKIRVTTITRI